MKKAMSIRECLDTYIDQRVENTKAYREAIEKSNDKIRNYELQQAVMYKKAAEYCVK